MVGAFGWVFMDKGTRSSKKSIELKIYHNNVDLEISFLQDMHSELRKINLAFTTNIKRHFFYKRLKFEKREFVYR